MREQDWQWLCEFILEQLTKEEKARITAAAEQRMENIGKLIEANPGIPMTTAENALVYYLNDMADD